MRRSIRLTSGCCFPTSKPRWMATGLSVPKPGRGCIPDQCSIWTSSPSADRSLLSRTARRTRCRSIPSFTEAIGRPTSRELQLRCRLRCRRRRHGGQDNVDDMLAPSTELRLDHQIAAEHRRKSPFVGELEELLPAKDTNRRRAGRCRCGTVWPCVAVPARPTGLRSVACSSPPRGPSRLHALVAASSNAGAKTILRSSGGIDFGRTVDVGAQEFFWRRNNVRPRPRASAAEAMSNHPPDFGQAGYLWPRPLVDYLISKVFNAILLEKLEALRAKG